MLQIKDWNKHFETHKTRILKRLDWVPIPNSMDGLGYIGLMDHPNAASHFGVWIALVEIASRCEPRGDFKRGGKALDMKALSVLSRIPLPVIAEAIPRLIEIGWIESDDTAHDLALDPALSGANPARPGANPALDAALDTAQSGARGGGNPAAKEGRERREGKEKTHIIISSACAEGVGSSPSDEIEPEPEQPVTTETVNPKDGDGWLRSIGWNGGWKFIKKAKPEQIDAIEALSARDLTPDESLDSLYMIYMRLQWFEEFWSVYWRKVDKKAARVAYFEAVMTEELQDQIFAAVNAQLPAMMAREDDKRPHAATWLHRERWNDTSNSQQEGLWPVHSVTLHSATRGSGCV
jgi:hypothetical protein